MRGFLYVLLDFLGANLRQAGTLLAWGLAIALVLASATALFFLPPSGEGSATTSQHLLILTLDPLLSEAEINRLAWQIAGWPETGRVNFRFAGESDPEPLVERALVVEARPGGREALLARVAKLSGIRKVTALERRAEPPGLPSRWRIAALVALGLGLGMALFLGQRAMRRALALWRKEREILRLSGLGAAYWQGPFLALGFLVGLVGAGLFLLGLRLALRYAPPEASLRDLVQAGPWLKALGFPAGAFLGLLGSLLRPHS